MKFRRLLFLSLLVCPTQLLSQDTLPPVVVSSTRLRDVDQPASQVPGKVVVVTAEAIDRLGAKTVQEVLQYQTGVVLYDQVGNEFQQSFDMRGFNAQTVDVTNADSAAPWRELLEGAGVRSASVSGSGVFKDAASDATVRSIFFAGEIRNWQIVVPDFGTIEGPFDLTALQYEGTHDGEVRMSLTLASAGALTFAAI